MKFNLVEYLDETRDIIQEYMWDAVYELNNAPLDTYIKWFKNNLTAYPTDIEQAVTDAYIEAVDYGLIKGVEKTKLTSYLKDFLEAHEHLLDDKDALIAECPGHLQHELKIVLSKLDESLTEQLLTETKVTQTDLQRIITYVKEQIALNNAEGIPSEHLRSRATDPSHAKLFNKYHSVDIIAALNASDSGLLAIPDDKDTDNFVVILS